MKRALLDDLREAQVTRRPVVLLTWLDDGTQRVYRADGREPELPPELVAAVKTALADGHSVVVDGERGRVFVQAQLPAPRMMLVGAVHIAQALAPMAALAGFEVIVIDPRRHFANEQRFAGVSLDTRWPNEALRANAVDRRSAVVTLSHDPKLDDAALLVALESEAFYVAALGSRRTHAARLGRLRAAGVDEAALARVHGPAGLAIGALDSGEIAVAILAQAIAALRGARGG